MGYQRLLATIWISGLRTSTPSSGSSGTSMPQCKNTFTFLALVEDHVKQTFKLCSNFRGVLLSLETMFLKLKSDLSICKETDKLQGLPDRPTRGKERVLYGTIIYHYCRLTPGRYGVDDLLLWRC